MAPQYKLHYLSVTAVGEPLRYLLSYGKFDWEDIRYNKEGADWAAAKPKMPFGQVPVLEINGKMYPQSVSLSRYLAKQIGGLMGKDDLENLQIDVAIDAFNDFRLKIGNWYYDPIPESQKAQEQPMLKEHIPFFLGKFEKMVKENGGYLVNGRLTWADIYFAAPFKYYNALVGFDLLVGYPALQALVKKIESLPDIAKYIAQRPAGDR